ncbi:hypothetical protein EBZ38_16845 [bacterium]|nr:hypothetical protein [bacterium]NDD85930.1 hypothetical protein [bacterium]
MSNSFAKDFDAFPDLYESGFKVEMRKDPSNSNEKSFQYKIKSGGSITDSYGSSFNRFTPSFDTWTNFSFNNKDMYLILLLTVASEEDSNSTIKYKITKGQFQVIDNIDTITNFESDMLVKVYAKNQAYKNFRYYSTTKLRRVFAILPFAGRSKVIQLVRTNNLSILSNKFFGIDYPVI